MEKTMIPGYTIGVDAYGDIRNICPVFGKKVAVIGGQKALEAAQYAIVKAIEEAEMEIVGIFWYGGEASVENIEKLRPQVQEAEMLFAVGGGMAIDTCKVLAHEMELPYFTFPTIASTYASCTGVGVIRYPDGSREYSASRIPPNHIFINTQIIADAPSSYLWAGMSETMAKYYECAAAPCGDTPGHSDAMGIAISPMCAAPILRWGQQAMLDCMAHQVTRALTEVILSIIISAGYVSNLTQADCAVGPAHIIGDGFVSMQSEPVQANFQKGAAAYGALVMLTIEKRYPERDDFHRFCSSVGMPVSLEDMNISEEKLTEVIQKILEDMDGCSYPCEWTEEMLRDGIMGLEAYSQTAAAEEEELEEE